MEEEAQVGWQVETVFSSLKRMVGGTLHINTELRDIQ
jgi:hypothetical protein